MKNETNVYLDKDSICLDDIEKNYINLSPDDSIINDNALLNNSEKIEVIANHFKVIMQTLGLDLNDDSLKDTPTWREVLVRELAQASACAIAKKEICIFTYEPQI